MSGYDNLKEALAQQKTAFANLESEIKSVTESDISKENAKLRKELEKLTEDYAVASSKLKEAQAMNTGLKSKLYEQIYSEKISIVSRMSEKADIYFKDTNNAELNRLEQLSDSLKERISKINQQLSQNAVEASDELCSKLNELEESVIGKMTELRVDNANKLSTLMSDSQEAFNKLKEGQITDEQINEVTKKNNLEAFIGGNLINKVGILLIMIGIFLFSRLVYINITDTMRGILMFAAGGVMLGLGEYLNRKKATIASLGLSAGGIAVLYISGAVCYFVFGILSMYPALLICILITAAAFFLSMRYSSQTITAFALLGGYMPIFAMSDGGLPIIYGAMVYFIMLNCLALLISYHKKWIPCYFIGFVLNTIGTFFIIDLTQNMVWQNLWNDSPDVVNRYVLIAYTFFAFLVYTAVPILSTLRTQITLKKPDIVLLGLNTFISAATIYFLFDLLDLGDFMGAISVVFAAIYIWLGWVIEKNMTVERNTSALFYLTGLIFAVLFIPMQFDTEWWSLGWLMQGTLLSGYGILKEQKHFTRAGFIINGLCLWAFLWFDLFAAAGTPQHFPFKYFAITFASLLLLGAFIYKKQQFNKLPSIFRVAAFINLWIYAVYFTFDTIAPNLWPFFREHIALPFASRLHYYTLSTILISVTFLLARFLARNRFVADKGTIIFSNVLYIISAIIVLLTNLMGSFYMSDPGILVIIIGTVLLLITNIISVLGINDFTIYLVSKRSLGKGKGLGIEFYPIIISSFFVLLLSQNLMVQFSLQFTNMILTLLFAITSVAWIVFGFMKRYTYIRRAGLGLAMFSVAKLILFDLWEQTEGNRIIMFISLGIALVIISFVYQYFVKRLTIEVES